MSFSAQGFLSKFPKNIFFAKSNVSEDKQFMAQPLVYVNN